MFRGLSLAMKCMLLFGGAIVLIILAALVGPWIRMNMLIDEGQLELSRQMVTTWEEARAAQQGQAMETGPWVLPRLTPDPDQRYAGIGARELSISQARRTGSRFLDHAIEQFVGSPARADYQEASWIGTTREFRYARAVRREVQGEMRLVGVVELNRREYDPLRLIVFNSIYLLVAGFFVLVLAMVVFWLLTNKIFLAPVRVLRDTAETVRQGNLTIRSEIKTGDEFEELSETFNSMLTDLQASQDRLRNINAALDMKVHELAASNTSLHQAAKVKNEFLASVSHELRTPLNSVIGFTELLQEIARADADAETPPQNVQRRLRYTENILTAGRSLLNLINSLLEMARIEAGKVDLRIERMNIRDACEGLIGLITPQADKKGVTLKLEVAEDLPFIRTDPRKFQQIIFNFLSNAVKFTPQAPPAPDRTGVLRVPEVTLRAERLPPAGADDEERVRVSVIDNGPGIPKEEQERIFEKFYQLEGGHTREASGTGLGLAISKELAQVLGGQIQLVSNLGQGSMFSVILPVEPAVVNTEAAGASSGS
ncbi:MAG: HAMP domain-containing sensor histidine kinase [Phycisphaerales bacterium]